MQLAAANGRTVRLLRPSVLVCLERRLERHLERCLEHRGSPKASRHPGPD